MTWIVKMLLWEGGGACYPEHVTGKVGVNRRWKILHGGSGEVEYFVRRDGGGGAGLGC